MNPNLRALITDFRSAQDRAIDYLHRELLIPLPISGPDWVCNGHRAVLDASKRLDNAAIKLDPHGYGIDVTHPDFRVDFDYGQNGEIDCFDVWRLAVHRYHITHAKPPVGPYDDIKPGSTRQLFSVNCKLYRRAITSSFKIRHCYGHGQICYSPLSFITHINRRLQTLTTKFIPGKPRGEPLKSVMQPFQRANTSTEPQGLT